MVTKQEARIKIEAAEKGCAKVQASWSDAAAALAGRVSVNGYSIYHDPSDLRHKLLSAQASIQDALKELEGIEWPTHADYDQL